MALIGGIVVMYQTEAFWGLEDNPNANTMNNTMNTFTSLPLVLVVVAVLIAVVLCMTTRRAF